MNPITILELRGYITFQTVQINREPNEGFLFSVFRKISIICNYLSNGHENFFCFEEWGGKQGVLRVGFDIDCARIIFGIICLYELNLHLSSEKSTASIICTFD